MAHKIKGDVTVAGTVTSNDKNVTLSINGVLADSTGNLVLDTYTKDEITNMLSIIPLTRIGAINDTDTISTSSVGYVFYITESVPVFIAGKIGTLDLYTLDLSTIKAAPASTTFYVYVNVVQGVPMYNVSLTELVDTYTNCFIGTITTDASTISNISISKVSRFDIYRPSTTAKGSAIPVSSGLPSQPGSITGW